MDFEDDEIFEETNPDFDNGGGFVPHWEYARPCKNVFSLINGFCMQGGEEIQILLEEWIKTTFNEERRPIREKKHAQYIYSLFSNVKDQIFRTNVFKPLIKNKNSSFSFIINQIIMSKLLIVNNKS